MTEGENEDDRKRQRQKKEHCTMRWRGYEIGGQRVSLRKGVGFQYHVPSLIRVLTGGMVHYDYSANHHGICAATIN